MILATEFDTESQESEATKVLLLLTAAYPGHPWGVLVRGGVIHIRHYGFANSGWGMCVKFKNINHDSAVMKREIILMAGEWLERAGMKRGRHDADQEIEHLEGVPAKYQPLKSARPAKLEHPVIAGNGEDVLREIPRPQALKGNIDG